MKATVLSVAAISLMQLAVAQPHRHAHRVQHAKKDVVTVVNTVFAQASNEPEVIVYVDQDGVPLTTTTVAAATKTNAPVVAVPVSAAPAVVSIASSVVAAVVSSAAPVVPVIKTSSTVAAAPAASSSAAAVAAPAGNGFGLTYSPYNSDGTCKTASAVLSDFKSFGSGYSYIRTYGVDCNTMTTVLAACKANGLKLFAGVFDISQLNSAISTIVAAAKNDWSDIYAVSVGNELVNAGSASVSTVVAAIGSARSQLRAAGYNGPVVTVDTLVASRANPALCDASDFCAVNCHPFFDGATAAADSGNFLQTNIKTLAAVLANKSQKIVVTETGWPWQGETNGVAVPSKANQAAALSSIKSAYASSPASITLFNPYNMYWKKSSAGQFEAEPYWGFLGDCPSG